MQKSRTYKIIVVEMSGPDSGAVAQTDIRVEPDQEFKLVGLRYNPESVAFNYAKWSNQALDQGADPELLFESKIDF